MITQQETAPPNNKHCSSPSDYPWNGQHLKSKTRRKLNEQRQIFEGFVLSSISIGFFFCLSSFVVCFFPFPEHVAELAATWSLLKLNIICLVYELIYSDVIRKVNKNCGWRPSARLWALHDHRRRLFGRADLMLVLILLGSILVSKLFAVIVQNIAKIWINIDFFKNVDRQQLTRSRNDFRIALCIRP